MKLKTYHLFHLLAIVTTVLGLFAPLWWYFFLVTSLTLTTGLIYDSFNKKGLKVNAILIVGHFVVSIGLIWISFFSLQLFLEIIIQILRKEAIDLWALRSLKAPVLVDAFLFLAAMTLFLLGLYKSKQTTADSAQPS